MSQIDQSDERIADAQNAEKAIRQVLARVPNQDEERKTDSDRGELDEAVEQQVAVEAAEVQPEANGCKEADIEETLRPLDVEYLDLPLPPSDSRFPPSTNENNVGPPSRLHHCRGVRPEPGGSRRADRSLLLHVADTPDIDRHDGYGAHSPNYMPAYEGEQSFGDTETGRHPGTRAAGGSSLTSTKPGQREYG